MPASPCRATTESTTGSPAGRWIGLTEQISLCGRLLRSHMVEQTEKAGLSESQLSLLWTCLAAMPEGLSQTALAQRLMVSPALVSGLVEQLRRRRLLTGQRDQDDRRRQVWRVTSSGQTLVQGILAAVTDWARHLDDRMGARNAESLATELGQLIDNLSGQAKEPGASLPISPESRGPRGDRKPKGAAA